MGGKRRVSVGVILLQVDVLIGEFVQASRPEKRLGGLDQQDRPGKTVVVEAAPETATKNGFQLRGAEIGGGPRPIGFLGRRLPM